jgi:hypothetical protein
MAPLSESEKEERRAQVRVLGRDYLHPNDSSVTDRRWTRRSANLWRTEEREIFQSPCAGSDAFVRSAQL